MKIVVCIKQIEFIYARTGRDPYMNYIAQEDRIYRINPWDESALDTALNLKDENPFVEVIILTLGPLIAEKELRRCLAIGADDIYRIETDIDHDPWSKSILLAEQIKAMNADLIMCGKESADRQSGQTGVFIAHHLGLPFVDNVVKALIEERTKLYITRKAEKGVRQEIEYPMPAVLGIFRTLTEPRFPDFVKRKIAIEKELKVLAPDMEKVESRISYSGKFPPRPRPRRILTPDSSAPAYERINQLLAGTIADKTGTMLEGSPESQAEGIVLYLVENGFLKKD